MKTISLKIGILLLAFALMGAGCEKEDSQFLETSTVGDIVEIFYLKYDDSRKISYEDKEIELSIQDIRDSVTIDCSLTDFTHSEAMQSLRIHAYLKISEKAGVVEVASKPCGALPYKGNGKDIEEVEDLIKSLKSAPANQINSFYYENAFIDLFGKGTLIKDTPFRIFIAKASPVKYAQLDASIRDYELVFILTKN